MPLLSINEKKCVKCGICAEVCPRAIIAFEEGNFPKGIDKAEEKCIRCGHCVAVCPHGALSTSTMPAGECVEVDPALNASFGQVGQLIKSRRSIRTYKEEKVDKNVIEKVLEAARYAPTGMNRQPVCWKVIYEKEKVVQLKDLAVEWMEGLADKGDPMAVNYNFGAIAATCKKGFDVILRDAPHVLITYAPKDDPTARGACTIALATLDIVCHAYGIGTCWAGFLDLAMMSYPKFQEVVKLPEGHVPYGSMMFGYPKYGYKRIPLRKPADISWS